MGKVSEHFHVRDLLGELKCLVVDMMGQGLVSKGPEFAIEEEIPVMCKFCSSEVARTELTSMNYPSLIIFADRETRLLHWLLNFYTEKFGAQPTFLAVACENPSPQFLAKLYDYGVNQILSIHDWKNELQFYLNNMRSTFDNHTSEAAALALHMVINQGGQKQIQAATKELSETVDEDYMAAYAYGRALQASGEFDQAVEAFRKAVAMNRYFKPARSFLAENLLVTQNTKEAVNVMKGLEKSNKQNADRKFMLSSGCRELGLEDEANTYFNEAVSLDPESPKRYEAEIHHLMKEGKIDEAVKNLGKLEFAGPFLVAKVNEFGVKLSKEGRGEMALELYEKAHHIVRQELKYKITVNAALASYRMGNFKGALRYCQRCVEEYGESFAKIDKIRHAVQEAIKSEGSSVA